MKTFSSVDAYIESLPIDKQKILQKMREVIHSSVPEAEEVISYGIPTLKFHGKNLVHFAGYKNHIGFYPSPAGINAVSEKIAPYKAGKGTVRFSYNEDIPWNLVVEMVQLRASEIRKNIS